MASRFTPFPSKPKSFFHRASVASTAEPDWKTMRISRLSKSIWIEPTPGVAARVCGSLPMQGGPSNWGVEVQCAWFTS